MKKSRVPASVKIAGFLFSTWFLGIGILYRVSSSLLLNMALSAGLTGVLGGWQVLRANRRAKRSGVSLARVWDVPRLAVRASCDPSQALGAVRLTAFELYRDPDIEVSPERVKVKTRWGAFGGNKRQLTVIARPTDEGSHLEIECLTPKMREHTKDWVALAEFRRALGERQPGLRDINEESAAPDLFKRSPGSGG